MDRVTAEQKQSYESRNQFDYFHHNPFLRIEAKPVLASASAHWRSRGWGMGKLSL